MKGQFWCWGCFRSFPQWKVSRSEVGLVKNMCQQCANRVAYNVAWLRQLKSWVRGRVGRAAEGQRSPFLHYDTGNESYPHLDLHVNLDKNVWSLRCLYPDQWQVQGTGPEELEERLIRLRNEYGGKERRWLIPGFLKYKAIGQVRREK